MNSAQGFVDVGFNDNQIIVKLRGKAVEIKNGELWEMANRLQRMLELYFRDPQLVYVDQLLAVFKQAASRWSVITGEALDEPLTADFFIRHRTIALAMNPQSPEPGTRLQ